jgi:hypothetical protein
MFGSNRPAEIAGRFIYTVHCPLPLTVAKYFEMSYNRIKGETRIFAVVSHIIKSAMVRRSFYKML